MPAKQRTILGHEKNVEFFKKLLTLNAQGRPVTTSAYILAGPVGVGKKTVLFWFLQALVCERPALDWQPCEHCPACVQLTARAWPDLHILQRAPDSKNIGIDQVRELIKDLSMSSFLNGYKVGVIEDAGRLSLAAANALLKLLEEPNQRVLIFLLTQSLADLPATIASRSQTLYFKPVSTDLIYDHLAAGGVKRSQAKNLSALSLGRPGLALQFLANPEQYDTRLSVAAGLVQSFANDINWRLNNLSGWLNKDNNAADQALSLLDVWQQTARDLLLTHYGQPNLVLHQALAADLQAQAGRQPLQRILTLARGLDRARAYVRANVNPRLALEQVLVNL